MANTVLARRLYRAEAFLAGAVLLVLLGLYWSATRQEAVLGRLRLMSDYASSFRGAALASRLYREAAARSVRAKNAVVQSHIVSSLNVSLSSEEVERREFLADVEQWNRLSYLLALSAAALGFLLFALWTRRLVEYLREHAELLRRGMGALASGNLSSLLPAAKADEAGELVGAFNDMAKRLDETQKRVIEFERLAAFGQLSSGAAHAINNPLAAVIGYTELLLQRQGLDDKTLEDLRVIRDQSRRCDSILRNLRQFSAHGGAERRPVNIDEIVERLAEFLRPTLDAFGTALELRLEPGMPPVLANPQEIQQVFYNVLMNAYQAVQSTPDPRIRVVTRRAGERLSVAVEDNGVGIPPENLPRLFEPFFTTRPAPQGLGLGLSSAYGIVRGHGGEIKVSSEPGKGSRFEVLVPLLQAATAKDMPAAAAPRAQAARVLVVDDEPEILNVVSRLLRREGFQVDCVATAPAALEAALRSPYDLILSDYRMEGMDGMQLYEAVRAARPDLASRFVFSTGEIVSDAFEAFLKKHAVPVLVKPFDLRELVLLIRARSDVPAQPGPAA